MRSLVLCLLLLPTAYEHSGHVVGLVSDYYNIFLTGCDSPYPLLDVYEDRSLTLHIANPYFYHSGDDRIWTVWTTQKDVRIVIAGAGGSSVSVIECPTKEGK